METNTLFLGQVVDGIVGTFVVVGFLTIGAELHARVKSCNLDTLELASGSIALPVSALKPRSLCPF